MEDIFVLLDRIVPVVMVIGGSLFAILVIRGGWIASDKLKELEAEDRKKETKLILEKLEQIEEKLDKEDSKWQD